MSGSTAGEVADRESGRARRGEIGRYLSLAAVLVAGFLGEFAFALLLLPLLQHYLVFDRPLSVGLPGCIRFASSPHGAEPGAVVPYTPFSRFLSRANIRFHAWRAAQHAAAEPEAARGAGGK